MSSYHQVDNFFKTYKGMKAKQTRSFNELNRNLVNERKMLTQIDKNITENKHKLM